MQSELMGLMMMLAVGGAQAAPPEPPPRQAPTMRADAAQPRDVQPRTSSLRKAEIARRMFWLALSLRNGG